MDIRDHKKHRIAFSKSLDNETRHAFLEDLLCSVEENFVTRAWKRLYTQFNARAHKASARENRFDAREQIPPQPKLVNVTQGAHTEGLEGHLGRRLLANKQQLGTRHQLAYQLPRGNSIEPGKSNIKQNQVRNQFLGFRDRFRSIYRFADDFHASHLL